MKKVSKNCFSKCIEADIMKPNKRYTKKIIYSDSSRYNISIFSMKSTEEIKSSSFSSDSRKYKFNDLINLFENKYIN